MSNDDPYRSTEPVSQEPTGDRTEELPAADPARARTHSHRPHEFERPLQPRPAQHGAAPTDPGYASDNGYQAPPAYATAPVGEKKYGGLLPALAAGLVAAGLTIVLGQSAEQISRHGGKWGSWLGTVAAYFDARQYTMQFRLDTSAELVAAVVVGVGTALLTLVATLGAGRAAARGLLFFAVWGITAIAASVAAVAGGWTSGTVRFEPNDVAGSAMYGAFWGVVVGWIPALFAVVLRVGRQRRY